MKKLLSILLLWVVISMFGVTSASAFSLGGYNGNITIGMSDMYAWGRLYSYVGPTPSGTYTATNSNPFYSDALGYNLAEKTAGQAAISPGSEDSWGIANIDYIKRADTGAKLWEATTASTELTLFFYGFEDDMLVENTTQGGTDIFQVGGHVLVYEDPNKNYTIGNVNQRTAVNKYNTVTDGTLVLDYNGAAVRNYTDTAGVVSPYTTFVNFDFTSTTGSGNMLLDIVGGTQQIQFDTNMRQGGSDMMVNYSGDTYDGGLGWTVYDGPTGFTNVVPEPATMLLLGSGLLGLVGFFGRKKLIKKS